MAVARKVLIIVENLPVPYDRRVWKEATTLRQAGYVVSVICPIGKGYEARHEVIDGIHVYRHPLPLEARRAIGYPMEYAAALFWEFVLAWRVLLTRGFDVIHACNPPDLIFLVGGFFKSLTCPQGTKALWGGWEFSQFQGNKPPPMGESWPISDDEWGFAVEANQQSVNSAAFVVLVCAIAR